MRVDCHKVMPNISGNYLKNSLILAFLWGNISVAAPIITASARETGEEQRSNMRQIFSEGFFFFDAVNDAHPDTEQRRCRLKISHRIKKNKNKKKLKNLTRPLHHIADETIPKSPIKQLTQSSC